MASNSLILNGAGGGSRTHTELPPPDFESGASAISPHRHFHKTVKIKKIIRNQKIRNVDVKQHKFYILRFIICNGGQLFPDTEIIEYLIEDILCCDYPDDLTEPVKRIP